MAGSNSNSNRELILPAELLDEIVVRLPIKSIIRFESVSKAWLSNFRSTLFKKFYEQRNNTYNLETVHTMKLEDLYKMVPTLKRNNEALTWSFERRRHVSAMGNGIYCLTSDLEGTLVDRDDPFGCQIVLFNPAICLFNLLPPFPSELTEITSKGPLVCGFDSVPGCLGYRVVVILNYGNSRDSFLVLVYSSHSGEWEKLVDYIPGKKIVGPSSATRAFTRGEIRYILTPNEVCSQRLLNGCWHWMVEQRDPNLNRYYTFLSFDFARQSFDLLNGPPMGYVSDSDVLLDANVVVLHDHLSVISQHIYNDNDETCLSVWMMMDYDIKESWTRIFKVNLTAFCGELYRIDCVVDVKDEGGSDGVFIERLFYIDLDTANQDIISIDHQGEHQVTSFRHNLEEDIFLNIGGISSYKQTLERPY